LDSLYHSYCEEMKLVPRRELEAIQQRSLQFVGTSMMYNFTRRTTDRYTRSIINRGLAQEVASCAIERHFNCISDIVSALDQ
jgi:hypothetical protein